MPYSFASSSRDGKVIAAAHSNHLFVSRKGGKFKKTAESYWGSPIGYTKVSANGKKIAWNEFAFGTSSYLTIIKSTATGKPADTESTHQAHVGFTPALNAVASDQYGSKLCEWVYGNAELCKRTVAEIPDEDGWKIGGSSEFSPNGKLIAVSLYKWVGSQIRKIVKKGTYPSWHK
jgi:hypothetical protein